MTEDTTGRKRVAERLRQTLRALRESEERFRALVEATFDLIWEVDADGRYTYISPRTRDMLGYEPAELLGRTPFDLMPEGEARRIAGIFRDKASRREPISALENANIHKDGRLVILETSALPMLDPAGELLGYRGVDRDITARRQAEEERHAAEMRVTQAQKLESLGVLAGGIAHDFNNLLVGIMGNIELARAEIEEGSLTWELLGRAEAASEQAAGLCRQMLAYARRDRGKSERFRLRQLAEDVGAVAGAALSGRIGIRYDLAQDLPEVDGDIAQLRQALMNLIINAAEAMGDCDGVITIRTGLALCDPSRMIGGSTEMVAPIGPCPYVEVADTGSGMDAATQTRLFEPFFTTRFEGRGLGLPAVLGIVRSHGGAIEVRSELGRGSVFRVLLPRAAAANKDARVAEGDIDDWRGSGTILLADDHPIVRDVGRRIMEKLGFRVLVATDGTEAVKVFRESEEHRGEKIACVILDLTMPGTDGRAAYAEIRKMRDDVPVIISSGYDESETIARFRGEQRVGFVHKPYKFKELAELLRATVGP